MSPLLIGGILNMFFTKTKLYKNHNAPIDNKKTLKDGKRIFGDNKTWIGFFSMIFFCLVSQLAVGLLCNLCDLNSHNEFYIHHQNTFAYNAMIGSAIGFIYMLFELPNSFLKRRFNIPPGKTKKSLLGLFFCGLDQIDSLIGVMAFLMLMSGISFWKYLYYICVGAATHFCVNVLLKKGKVRKNI